MSERIASVGGGHHGLSRDKDQSEGTGPQWMLDLEQAHEQLRLAVLLLENGAQPIVDFKETAKALGQVFQGLFLAYSQQIEPLQALRQTLPHLDWTLAQLGAVALQDAAIGFAVEHLQTARGAWMQADTRLAPLFWRAPEPAGELQASQDSLRLHRLERPVLLPLFRLPEPPPPELVPISFPALEKPKTFEELDAAIEQLAARAKARKEALAKLYEKPPAAALEKAQKPKVPAGFSPELPLVLSEKQFVHARTRDCFEEVTMIGVQRMPLLGDPWRSSAVLEKRLLAALDAIVALGPEALSRLEPLVLDAPAVDPSRLFALTLVLGCVEGRDTLAAAQRVYAFQEASEPEASDAFASALKLVPHPQLSMMLGCYQRDTSAVHRALALDVLVYRDMAAAQDLLAASRDVPQVAAVALPALALAKHPSLRELIPWALEQQDPALRKAAWKAMAFSAHPQTASVVSRELEGEHGDAAAQILSLVGSDRDVTWLLEQAKAKPSKRIIDVLGWLGAAHSVPALIELLGHEDEAIRIACAYALERITGAQLVEQAEVDPEEILVPDVPEPDLGEPKPAPLAVTVSESRDQPEKGSPDVLERPATQPERWLAYWEQHQAQYAMQGRYRRGCAYAPLVVHNELDKGQCTPAERRMLQQELIVRTGSYVHLDPLDFVVVQEQCLAQWYAICLRRSGAPGAWNLPARQ